MKNLIYFITILFVAIGGYWLATEQAEFRWTNKLDYIQKVNQEKIQNTRQEMLEKLTKRKYKIIDDLSNLCEVKGVPENKKDGKVIWDTNNKPSFGRWMFQVDTVKYYMDKLNHETISDDEAIRIAVSKDKARDLAYQIVWEEIGGIYNWKNCEKKLQLKSKIETIRQLENDLKY